MHTESSKAAHRPGSAPRESDQRKILNALSYTEPKTLRELSAIVGKPTSTVSARLDLLQRMGLVFYFPPGDSEGYMLVEAPSDYEDVSRSYRRRMTIARAKTLLNDLEFLPPYLIDAVNRFLMDNGEKPRIDPEPDKRIESNVPTICNTCNGKHNNIIPCPKCGGLSESLFDVCD